MAHLLRTVPERGATDLSQRIGMAPAEPSHGDGPVGATLTGGALLDRLRITGRPRPAADPARRPAPVRTGAGPASGDTAPARRGDLGRPGPAAPLIVTKDRLNRALSPDADRWADEYGRRPPSVPMTACGAMVDVLFRQLVTVGSIGDPMADALAALSVDDRQRELASWIERLPKPEQAELRAEVERRAVRAGPAVAAAGAGLAAAYTRGATGRVGRRRRGALGQGRSRGRTPCGGPGIGCHRRDQVGDSPDGASCRRPLLHAGRDPAEPGPPVRRGHLLHEDRRTGCRSGHRGAVGSSRPAYPGRHPRHGGAG